ncbi:hypothetical protein ADM99_13960 [Leptolinea tardivitalis]|uniref:Uncharacterized protein n=1 Tax=Leptolinea tardivitalis TaxID=229920 RepID=A0A0P6WKJ2_9CHLR|nr:hypothetical protein ADM99_13960 [Leptolinea tardivitalis]
MKRLPFEATDGAYWCIMWKIRKAFRAKKRWYGKIGHCAACAGENRMKVRYEYFSGDGRNRLRDYSNVHQDHLKTHRKPKKMYLNPVLIQPSA